MNVVENSAKDDLAWLGDLLRDGTVGPIDPLAFKPAADRLFYFDHNSPEFYVLPMQISVGYEDEASFGRNVVNVTHDGNRLHYRFNSVLLARIKSSLVSKLTHGYWRLFCSHLQLSIYSRDYAFPAEGVFLDFGDHPTKGGPVLSYCTARSEDFCVVDPFFLISRGYFRLQERLSDNTVPVAEKTDAIFWRGSASGVRTTFDQSQRYLLCSKMESSRHKDKLDFGIINTPQRLLDYLTRTHGEIPKFAEPAERVSSDTFARYRYGVDVDGNSNSWGGFFTKMLSRSYLIRVASIEDFRQWYYPRLQGKSLYSIVRADLSDFDEVVDKVFSLPASEITEKAEELYEFATSMDVFDEIAINNAEMHDWLSQSASRKS